MLKITVDTARVDSVIRLEGRLAGPWVKELENVWNSIRVINDSVSVRVDLQGVTYVEDYGKQLLQRIHHQGGILVASGCMTKAMVAEITNHNMIRNREKTRSFCLKERREV